MGRLLLKIAVVNPHFRVFINLLRLRKKHIHNEMSSIVTDTYYLISFDFDSIERIFGKH